MSDFSFGGDWTQEKLGRVKAYLAAYVQALKSQPFRLAYIDAFAGTGYQALKQEDNPEKLLLPELVEDEPKRFIDGSAKIALHIQPAFDKFIFIEKDFKRFAELQRLKTDVPDKASRMIFVNRDANDYLLELLTNTRWRQTFDRAVLFLDPFGMQVPWTTIETIAASQVIDLWYLFPLGIAVNRMLKKDANISDSWRQKLDKLFGETAWYEEFYQDNPQMSLWPDEVQKVKDANWETIKNYLVKRLRTVFAGVASDPLPLFNSRNNPLYLLCFASGNPKGAPIAVNIAGHILGKR